MKKVRLRLLLAATVMGAILTGVASPAAAVVGGQDARAYSGMGSLQFSRGGDPNTHRCGLILVAAQWAVTNAHCVSQYPSRTGVDPSLLHARIGSRDRTAGGVVVGITKILVHQDWAWAEIPGVRVADIAVLKLSRPVGLRPFDIASWPKPWAITRVLGWGATVADGSGGAPRVLQQLDTRLVPNADCALAGITEGEICVGAKAGKSACYGDSGGPALQHAGRSAWRVVGGASRETHAVCGDGPLVYTDTTYYRHWIRTVIRTGQVPPGSAVTPAPRTALVAPSLYWV